MQMPFTIEFMGTPEAGKTSLIHRLTNYLKTKGLKTFVVQESAELLPSFFPKGSMEAHYWIRLKTALSLLEIQVSKTNYDVILIDRGIIDSFFWNNYYATLGKISFETDSLAKSFFKSMGIQYPDLVILLRVSIDESLKRRGGEGRLVNRNFLKNFNDKLDEFIKTIQLPIFELDTTNLTQEEVFKTVIGHILAL